jgi:hypothetical protein
MDFDCPVVEYAYLVVDRKVSGIKGDSRAPASWLQMPECHNAKDWS